MFCQVLGIGAQGTYRRCLSSHGWLWATCRSSSILWFGRITTATGVQSGVISVCLRIASPDRALTSLSESPAQRHHFRYAGLLALPNAQIGVCGLDPTYYHDSCITQTSDVGGSDTMYCFPPCYATATLCRPRAPIPSHRISGTWRCPRPFFLARNCSRIHPSFSCRPCVPYLCG